MANYVAVARTNLFKVTDEERYQELFSHLVVEGEIQDLTEEREDGLYHGFGAYDSINYRMDLEGEQVDYDFDYFLEELQKILFDDEAFIYQESGHEKLRCVDGNVIVVTSKEIRHKSLSIWAEATVKELLEKGK